MSIGPLSKTLSVGILMSNTHISNKVNGIFHY